MSSPKSAYSILMASVLASGVASVDRRLAQLLREGIEEIVELVVCFLSQPVSPATFLHFERRLQEILRGLGRTTTEFTCNECEPESAGDVPHDVTYEAGGYRRLDEKTPNKYVDTTFGRITLWRRGYRYWHHGQKEPNIFPF